MNAPEHVPTIFDHLDVSDVEELRFAMRVCIDAGWQSKKRAVLKHWLDTQLALKDRELAHG